MQYSIQLNFELHTMFAVRQSLLALLVSLTISIPAFAANPLSPAQVNELGKLYKNYTANNEAALAARKQAELLQTEINAQQAQLTDLQDKAQKAETELSELQEIDRKKPGKLKAEELDTARRKHLQSIGEVESAQRKLSQLKNQLTQTNKDASNKKLTAEHSLSAYRTRFEALASEAITRQANSYKVPRQVIESASLACDEQPSLKICKEKTQQEAQRRAIEKGSIIVVNSITEIKNLKLQKDEISSEVQGEISNLKILDTKLTDEPATYSMKIQATVTPVIGPTLLAEIQRSVKADMSMQVGDGGLILIAAKTPDVYSTDSGFSQNQAITEKTVSEKEKQKLREQQEKEEKERFEAYAKEQNEKYAKSQALIRQREKEVKLQKVVFFQQHRWFLKEYEKNKAFALIEYCSGGGFASTTTDLFDMPSQTTEYIKIQTEAAFDPSKYGKPNSMMAKAANYHRLKNAQRLSLNENSNIALQ